MELFLQPEFYISLLTLTIMEIALGVDNIVFISIITDKLPAQQQNKARISGLVLALIMRILLLIFITKIIALSSPLFTLFDHTFSWKDLILLGGGLFLIGKSTTEIFNKFEIKEATGEKRAKSVKNTFFQAILQIIMIDVIFSVDSILTAIGLAKEVITMIIAVVIGMGVMVVFVNKISNFINKHISLKILALSFLLMIGVFLIMDGLHLEVSKGYIYFALFFALVIEILKIQVQKRRKISRQKAS